MTKTVVREIQARTLLNRVAGPDPWFGLDYGMNLYRGCQHRCVYCDSRSACYGIDGFDREVLVKKNAVALLERELRGKRRKGVVGTGSMNDPYQPVEGERGLVRAALQLLPRYGFGVHVITKSDLVLRDVDLLRQARRTRVIVSMTITTMDDRLASKIEPVAPPPSRRIAALRRLAQEGIETRVTLMPVLPFLEDNEENLGGVIEAAEQAGVSTIVAAFGVTLRDRQRAYYYRQLDALLPGLRRQYERRYGERYVCHVPQAHRLRTWFESSCRERGILTRLPDPVAEPVQLALWPSEGATEEG